MKILSILCFFLLFYNNIATAEGYLPQRIEETSPTEHLVYTFTYDKDNRPSRIEKENLPTDQTPNANISVYEYTYNPDNSLKQVVLSKYTTQQDKNHNKPISKKTYYFEYQFNKDTILLISAFRESIRDGKVAKTDYTIQSPGRSKILVRDNGFVIQTNSLRDYSKTMTFSITKQTVKMIWSKDYSNESTEMILHQDGKEGIYKHLNWPLYWIVSEGDTGLPNLPTILTNTTSIEQKDYPNNPLTIFEYEYNEHNYPSKVYVDNETYQIEYIPAN